MVCLKNICTRNCIDWWGILTWNISVILLSKGLLGFQVFHCVHFECPSCEDVDTNAQTSAATSKSVKREKREIGSVDQETLSQPTETATEAEEIPAGAIVGNLPE